jgi:hypothetical protein
VFSVTVTYPIVGEETENVQEELKSVSKQEKGNGRPFE